MDAYLCRLAGAARWALAALLVVAIGVLAESSARADLFASHEVTAQFATPDGKPMANAEVRVFAPGDLRTPVETGHTDADGKFVFDADRDGLWSAEAHTKTEVARVTIRVGGPDRQPQSRLPPILVLGGLIALLGLAWWYRMLRMRNQRRP
jgi:hypothetical protein